jgi:hypothetical protein
MAVVTLYGSRIMTGLVSAIPTKGAAATGGGVVRKWVETVETGAADSATSTYTLARLPSSARIFGSSKLAHDALGATPAALGIGIYNPSGVSKITDDPDALNTALVASTAGTKEVIADKANWGKQLWQYVNGQTTDPCCDLEIKVVIEGAVHLSSGAGTITLELDHSFD